MRGLRKGSRSEGVGAPAPIEGQHGHQATSTSGTHPFQHANNVVHAGISQLVAELGQLGLLASCAEQVFGDRVRPRRLTVIVGVGEEHERELANGGLRFGETIRAEEADGGEACEGVVNVARS